MIRRGAPARPRGIEPTPRRRSGRTRTFRSCARNRGFFAVGAAGTLAFAGAERLDLAVGGELVVQTPAGEVRLEKPVACQEAEGEREAVDGAYLLVPLPAGAGRSESTQQVGFALGSYDPAQPLVIDPGRAR